MSDGDSAKGPAGAPRTRVTRGSRAPLRLSTETAYDIARNAVKEIDGPGNETDKDCDRANRLRHVTGRLVAPVSPDVNRGQ